MPASAKAAAMASLSAREKATPGACSPSRNVVSTSQARDLCNVRSISALPRPYAMSNSGTA